MGLCFESVGSIESIGYIESIGSVVHIASIPHLMNLLDRENKKEGGEQFENQGFSCKSNYKVKLLLRISCFSWFVRSFCIWHFVGHMT